MAIDIVRERLAIIGANVADVHGELIGVDSVDRTARHDGEPREVRARIVGRAPDEQSASAIGGEVEALYTNGPAGGGGASRSVRRIVGILSTFIRADLVTSRVEFVES
jgi:hypothetical protein